MNSEPPPTPGPARSETPPGLDAARHATAQEQARQAELLREGVFPALMAAALKLDAHVQTGAYRVFLSQVMTDLGGPKDPILRMLIEQICMAHFRVAQLHVGAANATAAEAVKLYTASTARLLGELRRTVTTFQAYRAGTPKNEAPASNLRLFKAAR